MYATCLAFLTLLLFIALTKSDEFKHQINDNCLKNRTRNFADFQNQFLYLPFNVLYICHFVPHIKLRSSSKMVSPDIKFYNTVA
jgi:hypothetical protein